MIYRATMPRLLALFDGEQGFDQPYGVDGYCIQLDEPPFDRPFQVAGSFVSDCRSMRP